MKINLLVLIEAMLAITSCKKNYVCRIEWFDGPTEDVFKDLNKAEAEEVQTSCEALGGKWSIQ